MDRSINPAVVVPARVPDGRKILIVDDQPAVLRVLRTSLEHHGFIVCGEADNGIDAIGRAVATRPDLVILDVAMLGLNGLEVASILQRLLKDVPMILHTIYGDHVGASFGVVFGVRAIVAKSDGISKLIDCVHSVLKGAPESDQP